MAAQREPHDAPAIQAFGITLQKMRDAAGLSKVHFAESLGYSPQFIGQVENARNIPSKTFAQDVDTYFKVDALFVELWHLIKGTRRLGTAPSSWATYLELERAATTIRVYETRVVPGLFQTDDYARALFASYLPPGKVEEAVGIQAERRAVFERENPPHVFLVIDEEALRRRAVPPEVARAQRDHLLCLSERPGICLQVLAHDTDHYTAYSGSFTILALDDQADTVYIESGGLGSLIDAPAAVTGCMTRFDFLRGHAYSVKESRAILEAHETGVTSPPGTAR